MTPLLILVLFVNIISSEITGPYHFQSKNYAAYHLGYEYGSMQIVITQRGKRFYLHSPGLTGESGTVSFESADFTNYFLRHYASEVDMEDRGNPRNPDLFDQDATYRINKNKYFEGYYAFESVNLRDYYLRHQGYRAKLSLEDAGSSLFISDASWRPTEGPFLLQPQHHPWAKVGVDNHYQAIIMEEGASMYVIAGLHGEPNTVSFELYRRPGTYLRAFGTYLNFEPLLNAIAPDTFNKDASFIMRPGYFKKGYFAFESSKHEGRFLCQRDQRLRLLYDDGSDVFKQDASFRYAEGPLLMQSFNMDDHHLGLDDSDMGWMTINGTSFHAVYPGLTGQLGSVSLEAVGRPGWYLRHFDYDIDLEHEGSPRNKGIFDQDASWIVREELWRENTISFESVNLPDHYIRHFDYRVKIGGYEDRDIVKEDMSFYRNKGRWELPPEKEIIDEDNPKSSNAGAIAGGVIGGLICAALIGVAAFFFVTKWYLPRRSSNLPSQFDNPSYGKDTGVNVPTSFVSEA